MSEKTKKIPSNIFKQKIKNSCAIFFKQTRSLEKMLGLYSENEKNLFDHYNQNTPINIKRVAEIGEYFGLTYSTFKLYLREMNKAGILVSIVKKLGVYYIEIY